MAMDLKQLKQRLKDGRPDKAYLLCGDDNYILKRASEAVESSLKIEYEELNYNKFDNGVSVDILTDTLQMLPFMSEYRLVTVREYYPNSVDSKKLAAVLSGENDTSVLVVVNSKPSDNLKKLSKSITVVDCNHPVVGDCARWISSRLKTGGLVISSDNAVSIAEYLLRDMAAISLQCDKLLSYLSPGDTVTEQVIDDTVTKQSAYRIFEFTDAVAARDRTKAYSIMESMLAGGNSETLLLYSLYNHFRGMLFISISGMNPGAAAGELGVAEFVASRMQRQARLFTPKVLKTAVNFLADTEYKLKSGKLSAGTFFKYVILRLISI